VCVLHSGAISSPFLFLSVPEGDVWLQPSSSPGNTEVPRLLPQPLTEPTACNMDAGDDEAEVPGSSGGVEEGKSHRKTPKTQQLSNAILSRCSYVLSSVVTVAPLPLLSTCFVPKTSVSITLHWPRLFFPPDRYEFSKTPCWKAVIHSFILPYGHNTDTNFLSE
jgi:hypothetical protein